MLLATEDRIRNTASLEEFQLSGPHALPFRHSLPLDPHTPLLFPCPLQRTLGFTRIDNCGDIDRCKEPSHRSRPYLATIVKREDRSVPDQGP